MGLNEQSPINAGEPNNPSLEQFRQEIAVNSIRGTLIELFENGGAISNDGNDIFYNFKVPYRLQGDLERNRLVACSPHEIDEGKAFSLKAAPKLRLIPPHTDQRLSYAIGTHGGIWIYVLHGLDNEGKPDYQRLFGADTAMDALTQMAKRRLDRLKTKSLIIPKPGTIVRELLREIADTSGLGHFDGAVMKIKREQEDLVNSAKTFLQTGK